MISVGLDLIIFPQVKQNFCFACVMGLHFVHVVVCLNMGSLKIFSETKSSRSVPRNINVDPPRRWNISRAKFSPY